MRMTVGCGADYSRNVAPSVPNATTRLDPQADWIGADVNPTPQFGSTLVNAAETLSKT